MKPCILKKDTQEHYNLKRGWFVNAWRLVDPVTKQDLVKPWSNTKKEARETAAALDYQIVGEE